MTARDEALHNIGLEIAEIMRVYDEQIERNGYVDTPGGLEHMGDVWSMLDRWRHALVEAKLS